MPANTLEPAHVASASIDMTSPAHSPMLQDTSATGPT